MSLMKSYIYSKGCRTLYLLHCDYHYHWINTINLLVLSIPVSNGVCCEGAKMELIQYSQQLAQTRRDISYISCLDLATFISSSCIYLHKDEIYKLLVMLLGCFDWCGLQSCQYKVNVA